MTGNEMDELRDKLAAEGRRMRNLPLWKKCVFGGLMLFLLIYLGWCAFRPATPKPGQLFAQAAPAHQVGSMAKVPGPVMKAPLRVLPKEQVKKKLPDLTVADIEQVIDTAEIPAAPYGAQTATVIDPDTGEAKTEVKINPRPFFSLEAGTEVGARYGLAPGGQAVQVYVRRDLVRFGGVYVAGYGEATARIGADAGMDGKAMVDISYRW